MIIINSHIARINNVVGYNNTISRGDIVLLNDDAYVATYILKQEIESISPTIRCNYILLISSESKVTRKQSLTIKFTPDLNYDEVPQPGSIYANQHVYIISEIFKSYFEFATMVFKVNTLEMDTTDLEDKFKEADKYNHKTGIFPALYSYPKVFQLDKDVWKDTPEDTNKGILYNF